MATKGREDQAARAGGAVEGVTDTETALVEAIQRRNAARAKPATPIAYIALWTYLAFWGAMTGLVIFGGMQ